MLFSKQKSTFEMFQVGCERTSVQYVFADDRAALRHARHRGHLVHTDPHRAQAGRVRQHGQGASAAQDQVEPRVHRGARRDQRRGSPLGRRARHQAAHVRPGQSHRRTKASQAGSTATRRRLHRLLHKRHHRHTKGFVSIFGHKSKPKPEK